MGMELQQARNAPLGQHSFVPPIEIGKVSLETIETMKQSETDETSKSSAWHSSVGNNG